MPTYFSTADPVASLAGTIRDVLTRPTAFFRQMPADGSYWHSSILLLIVLAAPLMLGAGLLALAAGRPVFAGVIALALGAGFAAAEPAGIAVPPIDRIVAPAP